MGQSGDRARFLDHVRSRVGADGGHQPLRPLLDVGDATPEVGYTVDLADLRSTFVAAVERVSGRVVDLAPGPAGVRALLGQICAEEEVRRAVVTPEPECAGVIEMLRDLGVDASAAGDPALNAQADLGVTGALCGVALTGSIVVSSSRAYSRSASLLPTVHLALLPVARLVPTPGDVLRRLGPGGDGEPMPSNLVFITGPSRSADIELQITLGVHGPRSLWIGLATDNPS